MSCRALCIMFFKSTNHGPRKEREMYSNKTIDDSFHHQNAVKTYQMHARLPNVNFKSKAYLCPQVLSEIAKTIGRRPAETGGLLLGPVDKDGISDFIFDDKAKVTSVTYSPSHKKLTQLIKSKKWQGFEIKGFVHSHPGVPNPSLGDLNYVNQFFHENPSMKKFYLPILPFVPLERLPEENEWPDVLRFYVVERHNSYIYHTAQMIHVNSINDMPTIETEQGKPLFMPDVVGKLDLRYLKNLMGQKIELTASTVEITSRNLNCLLVNSADTSLIILLPTEFPILSPTVLVIENQTEIQYRFQWHLDSKSPVEKRLSLLIKSALEVHHREF